MYTSSILWILSWPLLLLVSYQAIKFVVKRFEKKIENEENETGETTIH